MLVVRLAAHGEVPGVVLAAGLVVDGRFAVVDLGGPGTADLAASGGACAGGGTGSGPDVRFVEGAGTPIGAPCGDATGGDGLAIPLAPLLVVGAVSENASRRARQRLTVIDGRGAVHVRQNIPVRAPLHPVSAIGRAAQQRVGGALIRRRAGAGDTAAPLLARSQAREQGDRRSGRRLRHCRVDSRHRFYGYTVDMVLAAMSTFEVLVLVGLAAILIVMIVGPRIRR